MTQSEITKFQSFLLKGAGWKLQQPVKVVKYEEF